MREQDVSAARVAGRRWIWCGPAASSMDGREPAISLAAMRWQRGLLGGLASLGIRVRTLGYVPEPAWPRGRLLAGARGAYMLDFQCESGGVYPNLLGLREAAISWSQLRAIGLRGEQRQAPVVLTYNIRGATAATGGILRVGRGAAWIPIIADRPFGSAARVLHDSTLRLAAGCVFLSHSAFVGWDGGRKLHLDGGTSREEASEDAMGGARALLYTGTLSHYAGLDLLLDGFATTSRADCELWICGKGDTHRVEAAAARDRRIRYFGVLPEAELRALSRRAEAFLNPRAPEVIGNAHNFPSKVLEYLSYGKPVISTWTGGLAPEYRDVLIVSEPTPKAFGKAMERVLGLSAEERRHVRDKTFAFLETRTWTAQAGRLHAFVEQCTG
jgi:glycosyltransferase involved in cell wall biosynthesis